MTALKTDETFKERLESDISTIMGDHGRQMHSTTVECVSDIVMEFLIKEKIIERDGWYETKGKKKIFHPWHYDWWN